jgi:hypothetical protein
MRTPPVSEPDLSLAGLADAAVAASAERRASGRSGVVAVDLDGAVVGMEIVDGRVLRTVAAAEAAVAVPLTGAQLRAIVDGSLSLAQGFMRGDIKPEGATGPLLALIELFEDADFRSRLATSCS